MKPLPWVNSPAARYRWGLRLWQIRRDRRRLLTGTWRPVHTCTVLRWRIAPMARDRCRCEACGALWGPIDRWGGRVRINEDGTPWSRDGGT